ncbi:hypothetical protein E2K98_22035 [Bacillus salipaludis]|uniref:Uncharacterized protein n=1 Tax=Bacillus salipaludis TaxID=2547811 RepID=A0A4R5VN90_9BACI|nr:hypothetical protein [Bacillus salipaludis]MDQ6599248.1 hypothetical protein [Bacillus salipaludis]TDK58890.1 hypothetical protein E2K98_22035 [Bacillus salipaludis]
MPEMTKFHHRQVVVNTYVDEELVKRDGFWFEDIIMNGSILAFRKEGKTVNVIELPDGIELKTEAVFKNYYSLNIENKKIEIYFP